MAKLSLSNLDLIELQVFLEHIRLGPDHVKLLLNKKQFSEVIELGYITLQQLKEVKTDKNEKFGNLALVLNTIITGSFGAWMGLSGSMELDLGSPVIFVTITLVTCLLCGAIGYNKYQLIKEQSANAIKQQKFANLEINILSRIQVELQKKIYKLEGDLYRAVEDEVVKHNQKPTKFVRTEEDSEVWLQELSNFMQQRLEEVSSSSINDILKKEWETSYKKIKKILQTHFEFINQLSSDPLKQHEREKIKKRHKSSSGLELLIDPALSVPEEPHLPSWIDKNKRAIIVNLAPTLLGGFGSMFVFVGGIPDIAQAFGCEECYAFLTHFYARLVEIGLAILITFYFGFAHLYSSRKSAQRAGYLTKTKQSITNQETAILAKNAQVKMLYKIKYILSGMFSNTRIWSFETSLAQTNDHSILSEKR
ncbi:MAG: hypothetical protein H0T62_06765 [Parachlamydiaceae bacterium]|nr:hypothetical protein [Parachlamydiaceae bacterium]